MSEKVKKRRQNNHFGWFKHINFKSVYTIQYNFLSYKHKDKNGSKSLSNSSPLQYFDKV